MAALSAYGLAYYTADHKPREFEGNFPYLVAGVAAMAISHCYPVGDKPTDSDVKLACWMFFNLEHPQHGRDELTYDRLFVPELYRQLTHREAMPEEVARATLLFDPQSRQATRAPAVMTDGWEDELLGCSVAEFMSAGLLLYFSALIGLTFPLPNDPGIDIVYEAFGSREHFEHIVERLYVSDVNQFRAAHKKAVDDIRAIDGDWVVSEPFAFNPLVNRPLLRGLIASEPETAMAPVPALIAARSSVEGVIYEGLARCGTSFTTDVGDYFEGYVGRQLGTMVGPTLLPEIAYQGPGGSERKTVDWFVILPSAVMLVECKSSLPNRNVIEGRAAFADGFHSTNRAREQVQKTVELIRNGQPELCDIPSDRPLLGLVVTLGSFYGANDPEVIGDNQKEVGPPVAAIDIASLERLVTLPLADVEKFASSMLSEGPDNKRNATLLINELRWEPNQLLQEAYDSLPIINVILGLQGKVNQSI